MAIITETKMFVPVGYDSGRSAFYQSLLNPTAFLDEAESTDKTTVYLVRGANAETFFYLVFDFSSIPSNAEITSVTAKTRGRCSGNSNRISLRQVRGYIGDNAKGYSTALTASDQTITLDLGTGGFTRESLQDFTIRWYAKRANNSSQANYSLYFYVYGADVTVTYSYDDGETAESKAYKKVNDSWVPYTKAYKKINNLWVEQTDLSNLIQTDKPYIWG